MSNHVIYIPGLGDHKTYGQHIALKLWRLYGVKTHYLPLGWSSEEGIDVKLGRIFQLIDALTEQGHSVSLVGVSAGASAVLNTYAQRPNVHKVVLVCGKVHHPENIRATLYNKHPDFERSMQTVATALEQIQKRHDTSNILSIYSMQDRVVPARDSKIPGAQNRIVWAWSHASVIFITILFHARLIARFIRDKLPATPHTD